MYVDAVVGNSFTLNTPSITISGVTIYDQVLFEITSINNTQGTIKFHITFYAKYSSNTRIDHRITNFRIGSETIFNHYSATRVSNNSVIYEGDYTASITPTVNGARTRIRFYDYINQSTTDYVELNEDVYFVKVQLGNINFDDVQINNVYFNGTQVNKVYFNDTRIK